MSLLIPTLKKYMADNRRGLLLSAGASAAWMIFIGCFYAWQEIDSGLALTSYFIYSFIIWCLVSSMIFGSMKNTQGRISTLMTPATAWDKYAARWIVAVPVSFIFLSLMICVADACRVMLWPVFNHSHDRWIFHLLCQTDASDILSLLSMALVALSSFFFGSILWPKMSALKTIIAQWVISTLAIVIFFATQSWRLWTAYDWRMTLSGDSVTTIIVTINLLITLILWGLSYMRLKESDVVDHLL